MNTPPEVTQADRDAAADMCDNWRGNAGDTGVIRNGKLDGWHVVQAFARHRALSGEPHTPDKTASFRIKCRRPDGLGGELAFTFVDRAEFERFSKEYRRDLHVTDIFEYEASTCDEAMARVADFLDGEPDDDN